MIERRENNARFELGERSRRPYFVLKFVVLFLGIVAAVTLFVFRFSSLGTSDALETISIVINVLLTGALILLYRDLSIIQDRQVRTMKASYTPLVGIIEWEMTEKAFEEDSPGSSERLKFTLSNKGNSMARDLRVWFAISYETPAREARIRSKEIPVRRVEGRWWGHSDIGGSLPEGSDNVEFYATPALLYLRPESEAAETHRFREALNDLSAAGIEEARLSLSLRYRNATGEEAEIDFAVYQLDVQNLLDQDGRLRFARMERVSDAEEIKANAETMN